MDLEKRDAQREEPDPKGHTLSDPTHRRSLEESDSQTRSRWWGLELWGEDGSQRFTGTVALGDEKALEMVAAIVECAQCHPSCAVRE